MNQYLPQEYYYYYPQQYYVQWVESIVPVLAGVMMVVLILGMIRDLIKGKEVKLP